MGKWEMVKLGEVVNLLNGRAYKQHELLSEGKYPVLRVGNFFSNRGWYYSDLELDNNKYCENGDLLFAWSASFGPKIWNGEKVIFHYHIWRIDLTDRINKLYLYYLLDNISERVKNSGKGIAMIHTTKGEMENLKIPLPPLEEQQKIAKNLDLASELVKLYKTKLSELDKLIQSVFYDMFGDPVTNEKGWEVDKLINIGYLGRGVSKHRPRNDPELLGGNYPLVQTGEIANAGMYISTFKNTYSEIGLQQSKLWNKGTLCITIAANIAKTSILTFDACFPDSIVGFIPGSRTNQIFTHNWFSFFQRILEEQAPQSAQKNINLSILSNLKVIIPPLTLQQKFADIVTKIEEQKAEVNKALKDAEMLYNSLMQEYFE